MRCIAFIITVYVFAYSLSKEVDLRLTPTCILQLEDKEMPCAYFKERSLDRPLEESWIQKPIDKIEFGNQYSNITLVYKRRTEKNSVLVMIRLNEFLLPVQMWEIQPMNKLISEGLFTLKVAYAPCTSNSTNYLMRRIVNSAKLLEEQGCHKNETIQDCQNLKSSKLFMKKLPGNYFSLALSNYPLKQLAVEVLSAHCNITCRGDINTCSGVDLRNMKWENPSEALTIYNSNNDTSKVYYCARISLAFHECCMIYTETIILSPEEQREVLVEFRQRMYLPRLIILSIALLLLVFVVFIIRKMFGGNSYKCWPSYTIRSKESVEDGLLNNLQDDSTPLKNSVPSPILHQNQTTEVLLIYQKESEDMSNLMAKFRYILSFYVSKVWDPLDEEEIEKVNEDPVMWIENVLSRDHVKVILVENKGTLEWYDHIIHRRSSFHSHHLDNLFLYNLKVLHNDPYLSHDYQRLFIIRFSSSKLNTKTSNIVPCTRYVIPENFHSLITDLVGTNVQHGNPNFQPPQKEIKELEKLDKELASKKEELMQYKSH